MRAELGIFMDGRALGRLRRLVAPWGGALRVVREPEFRELRYQAGFSRAPFFDGLGVHHRRREVVLVSPVSRLKVAEVIHEMGHTFATRLDPAVREDADRLYEFDFLGWEMVVAQRVGLPWPAWREGHRDYGLWGMDESVQDLWACEVGQCTDQQIQVLFRDRVLRARALGLLDERDRPRLVRPVVRPAPSSGRPFAGHRL